MINLDKWYASRLNTVTFSAVDNERELIEKYERIRQEGKYNMFMDARTVSSILGISLEEYFELLQNYDKLMDKYGISRDAFFDSGDFGDPSDIPLNGNAKADLEKVTSFLKSKSYEDLGDALNKVMADPKLKILLEKGFGDGELASIRMSSDTIYLPVTQLLPTQNEIGLGNSLSYPLKGNCDNLFQDKVMIVSPIITYRKTFIIDGHHRWSQLYMINPDAKIAVINFDYGNKSPFRALRNFQGAVAVAKGGVRSSAADVANVYEMSKDKVKKYIEDNISDACVSSICKQVDKCKDKESVVKYILSNIVTLRSDNPPISQAPDRDFMPQTDKKSIEIAQKGQTNI